MNNVKGFARVGNLGSKDGYLFVFTKNYIYITIRKDYMTKHKKIRNDICKNLTDFRNPSWDELCKLADNS